jgi:hypothetical protein
MISSYAARPYHTDDAGTTEKGKFELEASDDYWGNASTLGLVFKHGLTDRMELDLPVNYTLLPNDERAAAPAQVYLKFALIPDLFATTLTASLSDPSYATNLILGKSFGPFTTNANLGASIIGNTNDVDMTYGLSGTYTIGRFETGAELGGTQEGLDWWQIGAKYCFTDWCSLDAGFGGDFEKDMNKNITTGLWFAFPISKETKKGD